MSRRQLWIVFWTAFGTMLVGGGGAVALLAALIP